jgi:hypothetical protein
MFKVRSEVLTPLTDNSCRLWCGALCYDPALLDYIHDITSHTTVTFLPSVWYVGRLEEYSEHFEPWQQQCLLLVIGRVKPRASNARWSFDLCIARMHHGFHSWFFVQSRSRIIRYFTFVRLSLRSKNTLLCRNHNYPSVTSSQWLNCLLDLHKMLYRSPLQQDRQCTYNVLDFLDSFS